MEEIVIQRVYSILLSCYNKYDTTELEQCMYQSVRDIVEKGMNAVRKNPSQKEKNKILIQKLVAESLMKCAISAYGIYHSEKRVDDTMRCIQENSKGLISMSVETLTMMIYLNEHISKMLSS